MWEENLNFLPINGNFPSLLNMFDAWILNSKACPGLGLHALPCKVGVEEVHPKCHDKASQCMRRLEHGERQTTTTTPLPPCSDTSFLQSTHQSLSSPSSSSS
jgi:hypothetical protein